VPRIRKRLEKLISNGDKGNMNNNYYYPYDDNANCNYGCENANQCDYYHNNGQVFNSNPPQQYPIQPQFAENAGYAYDSVVPTNSFENPDDYLMQVQQPSYNNYYTNASQSAAFSNNNNNTASQVDQPFVGTATNYVHSESYQTYPPCQTVERPWSYAQCYGYFGDAPCQFANVASVIDMEDFM
jgi:hypothetical protein